MDVVFISFEFNFRFNNPSIQIDQKLDFKIVKYGYFQPFPERQDRTSANAQSTELDLEWPTLTERRAKIKLNILHKAKLGRLDIPLSDLCSSAPVTRRSSTDFRIPQSQLDSHKFSYFPSTIRLWNSLPPKIKNITDSDNFSRAISNHKVLGLGQDSHRTSNPSFNKYTSQFLTPVQNFNLLGSVPDSELHRFNAPMHGSLLRYGRRRN